MGACATKPKALDGQQVPEDKPIESSTETTSDVSSSPVEATTTTTTSSTEVVADSKEIRGEESKEEPQVDLLEPKHEETGKAATLMDETKEDGPSTGNVWGTNQDQQHKEETSVMDEKVDDAAKTEEKPSTSA